MSDDKKDERREKMLAALSQGMTWDEAADHVGVSARTLYRWCEADSDLAASAAKAKDTADDLVEAATFMNCLDRDPANNSLRMFWLKSRRSSVYRDTVKQEISGVNGVPLSVQVYLPANGRDDPQAELESPGSVSGEPG